jgi:hypothetical protein
MDDPFDEPGAATAFGGTNGNSDGFADFSAFEQVLPIPVWCF